MQANCIARKAICLVIEIVVVGKLKQIKECSQQIDNFQYGDTSFYQLEKEMYKGDDR